MRSRFYFRIVFRDGDDKPVAGGGGGAGHSRTQIVDRLIARHGTADAALGVLVGENYELREERRTLKATTDELQKKVPGEGAVVLTGDDAKAWTGYQSLKLTPEQVTAALTERDQVKGTLAERDRAAQIAEIATAAGFKPTVLTDLAKTKGLHLEMRDVQVTTDGKTETKKVPHVRFADKKDAPLEALDAFAKRELADYLPSLTAKADGTTGSATGGTPMPEQRSSGDAPTGDVVAKFIATQQAAAAKIPNPLLPQSLKVA